MADRRGALLIGLLILSAIWNGILCYRLMTYPVRVVEKPVTVEKLIPCPTQKHGAAKTDGSDSPTITGDNNIVNYAQPHN